MFVFDLLLPHDEIDQFKLCYYNQNPLYYLYFFIELKTIDFISFF